MMAKRTTERFFSAYTKLQWAKHHIDQLDPLATEFLRTRLELYVRRNQAFGHDVMQVKYKPALPYNFGLMIGDIANNLRSVLDHIIWELVSPHGLTKKQAKTVKFPFPERKEGLEGAIKDGLVNLAGPNAERIVRDVRPYPGGDDDLCGLHQLTTFDKHRVVTVVGDCVEIHGLKGEEGNPLNPPVEYWGLRMGYGPKYVRDIPIRGMGGVRIGPGSTVDHNQFDMTFHIMFAEGQPFAGLSVLPTMINLAKKVGGILDKFDEAYPSIYSPMYIGR